MTGKSVRLSPTRRVASVARPHTGTHPPREKAKGSAWWNGQVNKLANDFLALRQCRKCWSPHVDGYCCSFCGDTSPHLTFEQERDIASGEQPRI
jgi:hypothetical protein